MSKRKKSDVIVTDTEGDGVFVKLFSVAGDFQKQMSQQLPRDVFDRAKKQGDIIVPPYSPVLWGLLLEQSTRLKRSVETMALNTVGLGWELVPKKKGETFAEENAEAIEAEIERISEFFDMPNPEDPFPELAKKVKIDEEATGNGYYENGRTNANEPKGIWHVPAHTIRVVAGGRLFMQIRARFPSRTSSKTRVQVVDIRKRPQDDAPDVVFFKKFGDERVVDKRTGEVAVGPLAPEHRANEIIHMKHYTPTSDFYGVPRAVTTAPAVAGSRLSAIRNVSFFENDAVPRLAVIVSGGVLGAESVQMIKNFITAEGKGVRNHGRVMVLQSDPQDPISGGENKVQIELVPLTVGVDEDASFTKYRTQNDEEIREAFGIGKIFLGTTDDVNRASSQVSKQTTLEQVFEPEIRRYEHRINATYMKALEAEFTVFRFVRPSTSDVTVQAESHATLAKVGGVTPNDIRDLLGKPRFEAAWADTPLPILDLGFIEPRDEGDIEDAMIPGGATGMSRAVDGVVEELDKLALGLQKLNPEANVRVVK